MKISQPLVDATKKTNYITKSGNKKVKYDAFEQIWARDKAFKNLKCVFTTVLVLAHYDLSIKTWVKTNALDFITAKVLSQMHGEVLKPVAYFSKKITLVECNYIICDKKLLAVVKSFEAWKPELASMSVTQSIKVFTDYKNLKHFMITKHLNHYQAKWPKFLSKFNFKISDRPGKKGKKPDVLTKRSQDMPKRFDNLHQQHQFQTILRAN